MRPGHARRRHASPPENHLEPADRNRSETRQATASTRPSRLSALPPPAPRLSSSIHHQYARKSFEQGAATFEKLIGAKTFDKAIEIQTAHVHGRIQGHRRPDHEVPGALHQARPGHLRAVQRPAPTGRLRSPRRRRPAPSSTTPLPPMSGRPAVRPGVRMRPVRTVPKDRQALSGHRHHGHGIATRGQTSKAPR